MKTQLTVLLLCLSAGLATAATRTWDGSSDGYWSTPANWSDNVAPVNGDNLVFPEAAGHKQNTNDLAGLQVNSIFLSQTNWDALSRYRLRGLGIVLADSIIATNESGNVPIQKIVSHEIHLPVSGTNSQTFFSRFGASLRVYGALHIEGTLTCLAWGAITIEGVIGGTGGITKQAAGNLFLRGSNTFTGPVLVSDGDLVLENNLGLGSGSGTTTLQGGDILVQPPATVLNENLIVNVPGSPHLHSLRVLVGSTNGVLWAGSIQLQDTLQINAFSLPDFTNTTLLKISGTISGNGGLEVSGGAGDEVVRLMGSSANTYTGTTTVTRGTLELQKSVGDAIVGPLVIGEAVDGQAPEKVVRLLTGTVMGNIPVTIHGYSRLDLNGYSDSVASLDLRGGVVDTGAGTLFLAGDLSTGLWGGSQPNVYDNRITGHLDLGGVTRTFDIGALTLIEASIQNGGLIKEGTGLLTLSGSNTYAGTTFINNGILVSARSTALGATSMGTVVNDGGTLSIVDSTSEPLTLNGTGFGGTNGALSSAGINENPYDQAFGTIHLASPSTIHVKAKLTVRGVIGGTGPLTKTGGGSLVLSGSADNTFSGNMLVQAGRVFLSKSFSAIAVPGNLIIGSGPFGSPATVIHDDEDSTSHTIAGSVTVNAGSLYDTSGYDEFFDSVFVGGATPLTLNDGGDVATDVGLISLPPGGQVLVDPGFNGTSTISGRLGLRGGPAFGGTHTFVVHPTTAFVGVAPLTVSANLEAVSGTANVIKSGLGEMRLTGTNSFTGAMSVSQGRLTLASTMALGASGVGVSVNNGASLAVDGSHTINGEPLTLNSTSSVPLLTLAGASTWGDIITLAQDVTVETRSGSSLRTLNAIHGSGALTKTGPGALFLAGSTANTFTNVTHHQQGLLILSNTAMINATIPGPLVIGDGVGGANADVVLLGRHRQIANPSAVTILSSGRLDLSGYSEAIGSLAGEGNVSTVGPSDFETGSDNTSTSFSGVISGGANIWKHGTGTQTFSGANTYTGFTIVEGAGRLLINGAQPQSPVTISNQAVLGGSGVVGDIIAHPTGIVSPGSSAGVLTCSNAAFLPGSIFKAELNGATAGPGHDQLNVRGLVVLSNATLEATLGFAPTAGVPLTIINNDGADAVTGIFAGLVNGSLVNIGGLNFQIRYNGGTGNDVTLTYTNSVTSAAQFLTGGNGDTNLAPDECNLLNIVLTNRALLTASNLTGTLFSETPGVIVTQPFSTYATLPSGVRATNATPFQVSTTPQFVCGSPVSLRLEMQSGNQGSFAIPVSLVSAPSVGVPVRFDNSLATTIPNPGMIQQNIAVSNFSSTIARVEVSFFIAHAADDNLDIVLVSPGGTRVELTSDNGGSSDNYGTNCADSGRTRFSELGSFFIDAGTPQPPYVGTYRPEESLAAFTGLAGAAVNGNWKLEVTDDSGAMQSTGVLNCVSLFLYPAACPAGSGQCELCPDSTLMSALGAGNLSVTNRLATNGISSSCVAPKACPGVTLADPGARAYATHVIQNGPSAACLTAALTAPAAGFQFAIYTNSFDPLNLCANYLADAGSPTRLAAPTQSCAFNIAANQTFVVVVSAFTPGAAGEYVLSVSGGDCRPPLRMAHGGGVTVVEWSTAAPGYQLERTNALPAGTAPWPPVTNAPVIQNGRQRVTDTPGGSNTFYRLRRP